MAFDAGAAKASFFLDDSQHNTASKRVSKNNVSMGKSIFKASLAYDVFKKVLSAVTKELTVSIKLASDFGEENSKLRSVFKDVSKQALQMSNALTKSYGLSRLEATKLLGATGDILTGFGFQTKAALDLSNTVQQMSVDIASFTNAQGGAEAVSKALTKALVGERESLKTYGIAVTETEVQARILELRQQGVTFETERQAKAYATLSIAQEQSKNAAGDFARTQDSLANRQRQLSSVTDDLRIQFGQILVPILNDLTGASLESAKGLRDFLDSARGLDILSNIFAGVSASIQLLKGIFEELTTGIFEQFKSDLDDIRGSFENLTGDLKGSVNVFDILGGAVKVINIGFGVAIKLIKIQIQAYIDWLTVLKETGKALFAVFQALTNPTKWKQAKQALSNVQDSFSNLVNNVKDNVDEIVDSVVNGFKEFPDSAQSNAAKFESIWSQTFNNTKNSFLKSVNEMRNGLQDMASTAGGDEMKTGFEKFSDNVKKITKDFTENFKEQVEKALQTAQFFGQQIQSSFTSISGVVSMQQEEEIKQLEAQGARRIATLEKQKEDELTSIESKHERQLEDLELQRENLLITEEEFNALKGELEDQKAERTAMTEERLSARIEATKKKQIKKENEMKKKQFEAEKANQIAQVWIQAAIGIVGAWAQSIAQLGPIAGSIIAGVLTGLILGTAIAQTVVINQQQFVPAFETGGTVNAGGSQMSTVRMNEAGGELARLPDGTVIIPNDLSRQITAGAGNNITVQNNFKGAMISDKMSLKTISDYIVNDMTRRLALG